MFTAQLEKSRESTDMANVRSAYAEVVTKILDNPSGDVTLTVKKQQTQADWQTNGAATTKIAGVLLTDIESTNDTTITYDHSTTKLKIDGNEATTSFTS